MMTAPRLFLSLFSIFMVLPVASLDYKAEILYKAFSALDEGEYKTAMDLASLIEEIPEAQYILGMVCETAEFTDYKKAAVHFLNAAEGENTVAMLELGALYKEGLGVEKDMTTALKWYEKAYESGNRQAPSIIGACYITGEGISVNYKEALKWYFKGAEGGDPGSMEMIAWINELGLAGTVDIPEALLWYLKAAEAGNVNSLYKIGRIYAIGLGVPVNKEEARKWLIKYADNEYSDNNLIGINYETGADGFPVDPQEALYWYQRGAEAGEKMAVDNLNRLKQAFNH